MNKSIRVRILDRDYPLKVHVDNEAKTREIAASVEARMQALREHIPTEPDLTLAVMAALSLAEELERTVSSNHSASSSTAAEIESMLKLLDSVVD